MGHADPATPFGELPMRVSQIGGGYHFQDDDAGPMAGQQMGARGERQGQGTKKIGMDPIIPICTLYPKTLKGGYVGDCIGEHYRVY